MNERRTYRHRVSGEVTRRTPAFAACFPDLEEVPDDAKPLAYTSIPQAAIDEVKAKSASATKKKEEAES